MTNSLHQTSVPASDELLDQLKNLFGSRGGEKFPSNYGKGRSVVQVCRGLMDAAGDPTCLEYLDEWHARDADGKRRSGDPPGLLQHAFALVGNQQWEGGWALMQLHMDQIQKQEAKTGTKLHKGDPFCGLAIVARELGSPALVRHYAQLSSAGDVYWEHRDPELSYGGYGRTMLEAYESSAEHERWRDWIRNSLKDIPPDEPRYIEAFLAARWFGQAFAERLLSLSDVKGNQGKSFVEVLLDAVVNARPSITPGTGTRFEAAAGLLLSSTPGFEVLSSRKTSDQQTDLVVHYAPDRLTRLKLAVGPGLVECKSSAKPVGVDELRDFGAKCLFHRVSFGILVAHAGITGQGKHVFAKPEYAELVRRRFLVDGLTLLVLDISQLRGKSHELRGLQDELAADHEYLVFGPKSGELDSSDAPKSSP